MHFSKLRKVFLKRKYLLDLVIILVLGLLSLTWFKGNHLINGGDFGMPLDWVGYFKSMFSTWMENWSLGAADYRNIASIIPYASFGALMQTLGFSLVFIEKVLFYSWFVGGGFSMYFLCSVLGMKRLGKLMASVFFMLNPFSLIIIWRVSHALIQMPYSFAPLYLGLYIYGLKKKKGLGYIFLFCLAWIVTTIPAYAWPAALVIHLIPLFFYFLLTIICFPQERAFTLKFTLKLALIFLGLNFYWLFPFIYSISESMAGAQSPFLMNDIDTLKLTSVKIIDSIRMLGYWALHGGYKGDPYHPYEAYYRSSAILAISWLIPLMVFLGFLNKDTRKKPFFVFFIITILFGIIGMAGPYSPLGGVLIGLYKTFPLLALLTRFTILFFGIPTYTLFGVLLGYGFIFVYEQGKKFLGKLIFLPILVIAVLLFVVLVWPFWTGEVTARAGKVTPGERVKIPSYWWEAKKWFSEQKGFYRILPLPMSQTYNMIYDWEEGYAGGDPIRWISDNPVIFVNTGESFKIPELIGKIIGEEKDFKEAGRLLGMINVKYVLNRKDIVWNYIIGHNGWFAHNPQKIEKFLKNQKDLTLVKTFGPWEIYEVAAGDILPHIYIPDNKILAIGESDVLEYFSSELDPGEKSAFFFLEGKIDQDKIKKISPNRVIVQAKPTVIKENDFEKNLKELSLKEISDSLPHVKYYPGSPLYLIVRVKEFFQSIFTPASEKIDWVFVLMGKRLKESIFLIQNKKTDLAIKVIKEIITCWGKMEEYFVSEIPKEKKDKFLLLINKNLAIQRIYLKVLEEEIPDQVSDEKLRPIINSLSEVTEAKMVYFFGVQGFSVQLEEDGKQEMEYKLNIPVKGDYEIYFPKDSLEDFPLDRNNDIFMKIDEEELYEKVQVTTNSSYNLISLGKVQLDKGRHDIRLLIHVKNNLISDPSFENGTWQGVQEISQNSLYKSVPYKEQSIEAVDGNYSLKLFSSFNDAATFERIHDFRTKYIYRVSFSAKNLQGGPPSAVIWENGKENSSPIWDTYYGKFGSSDEVFNLKKIELPVYTGWRRYEFVFKPSGWAKTAGVAFFSGRTLYGETVNLFDDVRVERVFSSPILLKADFLSAVKDIPYPFLEYKKVNSAKYEISVKGATQPYLLIFSEAFHKDWNLSINGEHSKINDFANGWYIDKLGDYKITLFFKPQKVYYVSISITISSFVILVLYFIRRKSGSKSEDSPRQTRGFFGL